MPVPTIDQALKPITKVKLKKAGMWSEDHKASLRTMLDTHIERSESGDYSAQVFDKHQKLVTISPKDFSLHLNESLITLFRLGLMNQNNFTQLLNVDGRYLPALAEALKVIHEDVSDALPGNAVHGDARSAVLLMLQNPDCAREIAWFWQASEIGSRARFEAFNEWSNEYIQDVRSIRESVAGYNIKDEQALSWIFASTYSQDVKIRAECVRDLENAGLLQECLPILKQIMDFRVEPEPNYFYDSHDDVEENRNYVLAHEALREITSGLIDMNQKGQLNKAMLDQIKDNIAGIHKFAETVDELSSEGHHNRCTHFLDKDDEDQEKINWRCIRRVLQAPDKATSIAGLLYWHQDIQLSDETLDDLFKLPVSHLTDLRPLLSTASLCSIPSTALRQCLDAQINLQRVYQGLELINSKITDSVARKNHAMQTIYPALLQHSTFAHHLSSCVLQLMENNLINPQLDLTDPCCVKLLENAACSGAIDCAMRRKRRLMEHGNIQKQLTEDAYEEILGDILSKRHPLTRYHTLIKKTYAKHDLKDANDAKYIFGDAPRLSRMLNADPYFEEYVKMHETISTLWDLCVKATAHRVKSGGELQSDEVENVAFENPDLVNEIIEALPCNLITPAERALIVRDIFGPKVSDKTAIKQIAAKLKPAEPALTEEAAKATSTASTSTSSTLSGQKRSRSSVHKGSTLAAKSASLKGKGMKDETPEPKRHSRRK